MLLFDPLSFLLVAGGTAAASIVTATAADLRRAGAAMRPLLRTRLHRDAEAAMCAVRQIQGISAFKGRVGADRVKTPIDFVHLAAGRLADAQSSEAFAEWAAEELDEQRARHEAAIAVWRTAADAAPAMGMIGTVIGLVGMFAVMDDPSAMGPAMATAMLTTFYGLVISAAIAGPIAARLQRLSDAERRWQGKVIARLDSLARAEEAEMRRWAEQRLRSRA